MNWDEYSIVWAAEKGELEKVKTLLGQNAGLVHLQANGGTALHAAAKNGKREVAELLITRGAKVNGKSQSHGGTALHWAAQCGPRWIRVKRDCDVRGVTELLLAHGADVNAKNNDGDTPLHTAGENANAATAELLLENGGSVNAKNNAGRTPLHVTEYDSSATVLRLLLAHGADINATDNNGDTPLHSVVSHWTTGDHVGAAKLLLTAKAQVNAKNNRGETPLHIAAESALADGKAARVTELLVASGGDTNARNNYGRTPLHVATLLRDFRMEGVAYPQSGRIQVAAVLLAKGADTYATDSRGITPYDQGLEGVTRHNYKEDKALMTLLMAHARHKDRKGFWARFLG
jgi:ankyrin repeat protein